MPTDRELVIQLQDGSLNSLGELYERHQNLVYRTALGVTGDPAIAADLLQDVFLRVHRFAHKIDPERPLEPWLYRTTVNLTYTWVKRNKRLLRPLDDFAEWFSAGKKYCPSTIAEKDEEWKDVRRAVSRLPIAQRLVVVLYYINDLPLLQISEILDIPVGTVKSRLFNGRKAIKKQLDAFDGRIPEVQYEFT